MVKKETAPVQEAGESKPDLYAALQNRTVKDFAKATAAEERENVFADDPAQQEAAEEKPARRGFFARIKDRLERRSNYRADLRNEVNAAKANGFDEKEVRAAVFKEHYPEKVAAREAREAEREERRLAHEAERTKDREMHARVTASGGGPISHLTADLHRNDPEWLQEQSDRLDKRRDEWRRQREENNEVHARIDKLGGGLGAHLRAGINHDNPEFLEHQREQLAVKQNEQKYKRYGKNEADYLEPHGLADKDTLEWLRSSERARMNARADKANGLTPRADIEKQLEPVRNEVAVEPKSTPAGPSPVRTTYKDL